MNYYTSEVQTDQGVQKTAGIKARDDIDAILNKNGFQCIQIEMENDARANKNIIGRLMVHVHIKNEWQKKLDALQKGDMVVIQFPVIHHSILLYQAIQKAKKRGIKVVLLIHDLETFRVALRKDKEFKKRMRVKYEESTLLEISDKIIVHNEKMKQVLVGLGYDAKKMVNLGIFDYLNDTLDYNRLDDDRLGRDLPVIIAGNLRPHKAKYAYDLPDNQTFNLYGVDFGGKTNESIRYFGSFMPDDLPYAMHGSFGLVWDGEVSETCSGIFGEYLKMNNPHKTSLYLSLGIPVVIWSQAALATYIQENQCGIVVDSLYDIHSIIENMSDEQYTTLATNAAKVAKKLCAGYYTKQAVENC